MLLFAISEVEAVRKYNYLPDGREIVCHNGENKYTRALYGTHGTFRLETSDRPLFATFKKGQCRNIRLYAIIGNQRIALDSILFDCEARYLGGRRTYRLTHGDIIIDVYAMASFLHDEDAVWKFNTWIIGKIGRASCRERV